MSHIIAHSLEENTRTKDVVISENVSFDSLFLSKDVFNGLTKTGFRKPSPIQLKAVPIGRCGFDLIVKSKSGTGKTLVFSIIALENIDRTKKMLQALILAPTREIAVQIQDVIKHIGCNIEGLTVESFIGGLSFEEDKKKCKECQIAVGTPGRIKHLIAEGILSCASARLLVLDEADKLMEASFRNDINQIYNALPAKKQIITTSATYPDELEQFLARYMQSPTHVNAELKTPLLLGLKQFVSVVKPHVNVVQQMRTKNEELLKILGDISFTQCLVFSNYQTRAESISNHLNQKGWSSIFISAAQTQTQRLSALSSLKEFKCRILLSTDLTARGVDAANVDLVVNYDVPADAMTYLHRMGRAGRYGAQGVCLNLAFGGQEVEKLRGILGGIGGTALGIPKLPAFKGHISDLVKIDIPASEQIFGKLNDPHVDIPWNKNKIYQVTKINAANKVPHENTENTVNTNNGQYIMSILNDTKSEVGEIQKQITNMDPQAILATLANQNVPEENTIGISNSANNEVEEIKNQIADINPQSILSSLANQSFKLQSAPKCDTSKTNDTLLALLAPTKSKKPANKVNAVKVVSEEEKRQHLFTRNKALLDVTRVLDSPNKPVSDSGASSIEQYLNILKNQDKNKFSELSQKSNPDILKSIQDIDVVEEKENVSVETETFDLDNIFKLGYDCIVKSNSNKWKQILESVGPTSSSKQDPMDQLEDDESEIMESDEVEIMKWVPVKRTAKTPVASKNLLEEMSEDSEDFDAMVPEIEEGELTKWIPASTTSKEVQQSCLSDPVSEEINRYEHFSACFDGCDQQLWQNGLNFDNMNGFDEWFYFEWEAQLCAVRNYVQQNIYVQEMSRFQNSKTNK